MLFFDSSERLDHYSNLSFPHSISPPLEEQYLFNSAFKQSFNPKDLIQIQKPSRPRNLPHRFRGAQETMT